MITRRQATLESVTAFLHDPSMIFILGLITLAAGLAMVLAHNIWSGGALVVIVTIVGWITLLKSLLLYSCRLRWKPECSLDSFTTDNSSTCMELFRSSLAST
jgi:vacuolar-type H+-ATPase subunit I/STV1